MRIVSPDAELLARFHAGIYLDAFAAHREPLEAWLAHDGYDFHARIAMEGDDIVGGVTFELYPRSSCGLVTYLVVAPGARERGLGRELFELAGRTLYEAGARAVFGEVHRDAPERLARFQRWGASVVDFAYVQPALGPGLRRDDGLTLIVLPPVTCVEHGVVQAFVDELHDVTEQAW